MKTKLALEQDRDNFFVGMLPDSMDQVKDCSWDVVVCNSVFQYMVDKDTARRAVEGMIRVARKWVIIADVCDDDSEKRAMTQSVVRGMEYAEGLPAEYRYYGKNWWIEEFGGKGRLLSIRHVEVEGYKRRAARYCVYIEKM